MESCAILSRVSLLVILLFLYVDQAESNYNIDLSIVENAVAKGGVCLDGSPPAYYYDHGTNEGAKNWIIFLAGGEWCFTESDCIFRANSNLGSSTFMAKVSNLSGILSPDQQKNPDFYSWHRVYVNYCDGGSFVGEIEEVNPKNNLHFRGVRIFNAVVEDLLGKGMDKAENVILSGGSAGGLATILHCDKFRDKIPNAKRLKCLSDGGFFIQGKDIPGATELTMAQPFRNIVELHGIDKFLPESCKSKMDAKLCLFPENLVGDVQTPLFIVNGAFDWYQVSQKLPAGPVLGYCKVNATLCTPTQIQLLQEFRTSFLRALPKGDCKLKGMFVDSANVHDHILLSNLLTGPTAPRLKNKTLTEGFGDWYFERSCFQEVDVEHDIPINYF